MKCHQYLFVKKEGIATGMWVYQSATLQTVWGCISLSQYSWYLYTSLPQCTLYDTKFV